MKQNKETPTIAEMSEVVAKYMGLEISKNMYGDTYSELHNGDTIFHRHIPSCDWLHEVWEKEREEEEIEKSLPTHLFTIITARFLYGTPFEILTALYNCIIFINQLKQQANGKHSNI